MRKPSVKFISIFGFTITSGRTGTPISPPQDIQREIYVRLMLIQKAQDLEIHVGDDTVAMAAKEMLSSPGLAQALGLDSESVPLDVFVKGVLQPKGFDRGRF